MGMGHEDYMEGRIQAMTKSDLADVEVYVHADTTDRKENGAYRVSLDGDDKKAVWIPASQCELDWTDKKKRLAVLTAPEATLIAKGLV